MIGKGELVTAEEILEGDGNSLTPANQSEVAFVWYAVGIAVVKIVALNVAHVENAVAIAVSPPVSKITLIRHPVGVAVFAGPFGNIAVVRHPIHVAVRLATVRDQVAIAVWLALVWYAVLITIILIKLALIRNPRQVAVIVLEVACVRDAITVAISKVFALVRCAIGVAIDQLLTVLGDPVGVAISFAGIGKAVPITV